MNKNIGIALVALFAFGAFTASAQTAGTTAVGTAPATMAGAADVVITTGLQVAPKPPVLPTMKGDFSRPPQMRNNIASPRDAATGQASGKKQTQGATFGEKANGSIGDPDFDLRNKARPGMSTSSTEGKKGLNAVNVKQARGTKDVDNQAVERKEAAKKQSMVIVQRIDTAIVRVQKLAERTASRIDKIAAQGGDVTISRGHLANAKVKLDEARAKSAVIKSAIDAALSSQNPKDSIKSIEPLIKDITKVIQGAQHNVSLAISTLKPGENRPFPAASTTRNNR